MQPIFVGDVQGCADEFDALLERAGQRFGRDFELWQVGDILNRGPDNRRPLERIRALLEAGRARYVLGNHEVSLLRAHLGLRELEASDTMGDVLGAPDAAEWFDWLRRRPLVEAGTLGARRFAMLHAAAHPDWRLDKLLRRARRVERRLADPDVKRLRRWLAKPPEADGDRDLLARLTSCRSAARDGRWSKREPTPPFVPWHELWSANRHDHALVYGHWSLQGLRVAPGLRGLDTGCVYHGLERDGLLTAWLPDLQRTDPFAVPDDGFWQVRARGSYYRDASAAGPSERNLRR